MSKNSDKYYAQVIKKASKKIGALQSELDALKRAQNEPIAIIGMACRLPGANSPDAFWELLSQGLDAIGEVPADRWDIDAYYDPDPDTPGKMSSRYGGFLRQVDKFDAHFFGLAPRETISLDPQQRLLLEVSWEALENSALVPEELVGSQTGVFIGICSSDYSQHLLKREASEIDAYLGTGTAHSAAAGRLSYILGLQGPCLAVDTACSSSLVAVHLAVMSLRSMESNLALAGGVNVILNPELSINLSKTGILSPDSRCKTFDAAAKGFVRAEGCGMIVLKRLSDAVADGDSILALIRGSAINQNGRSNGLTVPNGPSQQALILKALRNAAVSPPQVSYVEAHGTATPLGDPIEVGALAAVYGQQRKEPLLIGSVKTNIGNLEGAAGMASLIKVVLSLQNQALPPHLHLSDPNPHILWDELPVKVPTEITPWPSLPSGEKRRIAGINTFGMSGINAHVVLSEAPAVSGQAEGEGEGEVERPLHLLCLSAKRESALTKLVLQYEKYFLTRPEVELADVCFTATTGRSHFKNRMAVVGQSKAEIREKLAGARVDGVFKGQVQWGATPKVAFLFTGEGTHAKRVGMGRELYETQPTFRLALDRCDEILRPYLSGSLLSVLYPSPSSAHHSPFTIDQTACSQPALFAIEYALFELWKSWGITPNIVMGHGVGEYVAACVAGLFSLEDGLKLIAARGRLMQALPHPPQNWGAAREGGEMVTVMADEARVEAAIATYSTEVSIAAINGSQNVVISGKSETVQAIVKRLEASGIKTRELTLSQAFDSPLIRPILADFNQVASQITYSEPKLYLISNVTGQLVTNAQKWHEQITTPDYWVPHVSMPIGVASGIAICHRLGGEIFIEIGPQPILLDIARDCLPNETTLCLPSLRQFESDWRQMLESLAQLYVRGVPVDWAGFERDHAKRRRRLVLPTYPWERKRYWVESPDDSPAKDEVNPLENGQPKADSLAISGQTPIVTLLQQAESKQLARLLAKAANFSADETKLLPKLLEVLVQEHQEQLKQANSEQVPRYKGVRYVARMMRHQLQKLNIRRHGDSPELMTGSSESRQQLEARVLEHQLEESSPNERPHLVQTYIQAQAAQVLGLDAYELDVQQPLSQLGLDSLMSAELRNRIQNALDINVPVASFLQNPSVAQLTTELLAQRASGRPSSTSYSPLVPIQPAGSRSPFFCVHPWAGVVYPYYDLANELGSDQPFYGLQSVSMYGQPDRTIEEMATHYIEALRLVAKPPYLLGGWSFGSLVAFEMAQQLHRAGDEVALLALLDTPAPRHDKRTTFIMTLKFLITMSSRYIWPYVYDYFAIALRANNVTISGSTALSNSNQLKQLLNKPFAMAKTLLREARSLTNSQSTTRRIFSTLQSNGQASLNYVPQPYPGRVTLFRVSKQLVADDQEQTLGWNKLAAGGVEVQMVPGHHLNLLRKPHVQLLATQLSSCIDQIQAPHGASCTIESINKEHIR